MASDANELTLRLDAAAQTLQLVDDVAAIVIAEQSLDQTSRVEVVGSEADDRLTLDATVPTSLAVFFEGGTGSDTLVGPSVDRTWHVTGEGSGSLAGLTFSGIENLSGGSGADVFVFDGGSVAATSGGGGADTLDLSADTGGVVVDLAAGTASYAGGLTGVESVVTGSGNDTLLGALRVSSLAMGAGTDTLDFGGVASDLRVTVHADGKLSATDGRSRVERLAGVESVVGGTGSDTLGGPDTGATWRVTGADAGSVAGVAFSGFENLAGGWGADVFVFDGGSVAAMSGGWGSDTLIGPNADATWSVTGPGAGSVAGVTFSGIENLAGGSGADVFALAGGRVDSLEGGAGDDTVVGPAADSTWKITGSGAGEVAGVAFAGVEDLEGGAGNKDTFVFEEGGRLSGLVEGGAAGFDTLVVAGGGYDTVIYRATGPDSGQIDLDGEQISYAGMEPVDLGNVADNFRFELSPTPFSTDPNFPPGSTDSDDVIVLRNVASVDGQMEIVSDSTPTTFESVKFNRPLLSLSIDAAGGADTITIESLDPAFDGQLIVIGGTGDDTLNGIATYDTTYRFGDDWGGDAIVDPGGMATLEFGSFTGDLRVRAPSDSAPEIEGLVAGVVANSLDYGGGATFVTDVSSFETADQATALIEGLEALADLGDRLNASERLATELLVLQQSIGDVLGIGDILRTRLVEPIGAFLSTVVDPTVEELVAALDGLSGSVDDVDFTVHATATKLAGGGLTIGLSIDATRTSSGVDVDLGADVEQLLTTEALTGELKTSFHWDVALELGADAASSAIRFDTPIAVTADLGLTGFDARTGFLGLDVDGSVTLDADVALQVGLPGIPFPFATLPGLPIGESPAGATATYDVDVTALALPGVVGVADDPQNPGFIRLSDDLFDDQPPTTPLEHNFDTLGIADFLLTDSGVVRAQLRQFGAFLDTFAATTLGIPIPLTFGTTLRDVFAVGDVFRSELLDLIELPPNTAATPVSELNDGEGVRTAAGNDIKVTLRGGQSFEVDLDGAPPPATLGDLVGLIETAAGALATAGLFEVATDADTGKLLLVDRTDQVDSNDFRIEAVGDSSAVSDLGLDAPGAVRDVGGSEAFVIEVAPNPGPNFETIQQLITLADSGPKTAVTTAQYTHGPTGPALSFLVSVTDTSLPAVQDTLALFDVGPLRDLSTDDPVTVTPAGTLSLPFQIELSDVGFQVDASTEIRALNGGDGVRTLTGQDDIRVQLLDGTSFAVDLSVAPDAQLAADLGAGTVAGDDIQVQLNDGTTFSVDLNSDALTSTFGPAETIGDVAQRIRDAAEAAGVGAEAFEVAADLDRGVLSLRDLTEGSVGFAVSDAVGSTAATDLGLVGTAAVEGAAQVLETPVVALGDLLDRIRAAATGAGVNPAEFSVRVDLEGTGVLLVDRSSAASPLTGKATAESSGAELEDTNASFGPPDSLIGRTVEIVTGTGAGQALKIVGNTETTLTLETAWGTALATDSEYEIQPVSDVAPLGDSFARVDLGLFGPGAEQAVDADTLAADANWGLGVRTVPGVDIEVRLRSGASFEVDLDHPTTATLGDLAQLIEAAAGPLVANGSFEIVTSATGALSLVDRSAPSGTDPEFTVVARNGSLAARDLGLERPAVEQDVDFDNSAELAIAVQPPALAIGGGPLHGDTPSAKIGLRQDGTPHIQLDASLGASAVEATGLWGPVAVRASGGTLDATTSTVALDLTLADAQLRELSEGLSDSMALIDSQSAEGAATLDLPLELASPLPGVATGPANVRLTVPDFSDPTVPPTLQFTDAVPTDTQVLLEAVEELGIGDVLAALDAAADYLVELETQPQIAGQQNPLAFRLPGLNRSLGQLLAFGQGFKAQIDALADDPAPTLAGIREALDSVPGVSAALSFDTVTRSLKVDVDLDLPELVTQLPLVLDLTALGVDLGSLGLVTASVIVDSQQSSLLNVTGDGVINLEVGIDLADASDPVAFLFDTTDGSFELRAEGAALNFDALFGSIAVGIENGSYALDADGAGPSTDPVQYTLGLADDAADGRHLFAEVAAATELGVGSAVDATLPVVFPEAITAPADTDIVLSIADLADVPGSTSLTGPRIDDLVGQIDLSQNLDSFRLGFDELFMELDDLLDRAVFGQALPLVGTQLTDAIDLTEQIRSKVSDNLALISTGLETDVLTPDEVRQALFDALGPGGLGWLQDRNGDGFLNVEDDVLLSASASEVIFDLELFMAPRTLEAPVDLDLLLPGLGLESDAVVEITYAFAMPLVFGISVIDGVFLDVSVMDEMTIDLDVALPGPAAVLEGNPRLTFAADGTITRDRGSWILDGFTEGQSIQISGSANNDGTRTISDIDPRGRRLTLADPVLAEGPVDGVAIETERAFYAELGFLPMQAVDLVDVDPDVPPTGLTGTYTIDLRDIGGNANDRLSRNELMARPPTASLLGLSSIPQLTDIHLRLETALPDGAAFPPYRMDLNVESWVFSTDGVTVTDTTPIVRFDDVQFELVGFVQDFLGAATTRLRQAFEPLDGLVNFLNSEAFPILSLLFGRQTYVSAAGTFGGEAEIGDFAGASLAIRTLVEGGQPFEKDIFTEFFEDLFGANEFDDITLPPLADLTGEAWIDIGSFTVDGAAARAGASGPLEPTSTIRSFGRIDDAPMSLSGSPGLTFSGNAIFRENAEIGPQALTLIEQLEFPNGLIFPGGIEWTGGNWSDAGFGVGDYITLAGTGDFDGFYRIGNIVDGGQRLLLVVGFGDYDEFVTDGSGNEVQASAATVSGTQQTWITDGFRVGQSISIDGTGANDGSYRVTDVTPTELSVDASFTAEGPISGVEIDARAVLTDNPQITFDNFTFLFIEINTITREDGRDWASDGFAVGQFVEIRGSGSNDDIYRIEKLNGDTIEVDATLTDEGPTAGISAESRGTILGQIASIARDRLSPGQDAANGFLTTQLLPGRGAFDAVLGTGLTRLIPGFFGIDPIEIRILEDASHSFDLLLGDTRFEDASDPEGNTLLTYGTPELFVLLYQDFPLDKKRVFAELPGVGLFLDAVPGPVPFISINFEARADFALSWDATGLELFRATDNPDDLAEGFYFDDREGIEPNPALTGGTETAGLGAAPSLVRDEAQARILGGIGLGVFWGFDLKILKVKIGAEIGLFLGTDYNFEDPDGDGKVRASEFDRLLGAGARPFTGNAGPLNLFGTPTETLNAYDLGARIEVRFDVFARVKAIFFTIIDVRINIATFGGTIDLARDPIAAPVLVTKDGSVLRLNIGDGPNGRASERDFAQADDVVDEEIFIGQDGSLLIVSGFGQNQTISAFGIESIVGYGGSGNDRIAVSDDVLIPVELHGGGGSDVLVGGGGPASLFGDDDPDVLVAGAVALGSRTNPFRNRLDGGDDDDLIVGGNDVDRILGGFGNDRIFGGRGADDIDGEGGIDTIDGGVGSDTIEGGQDDDFIFGGLGNDTIFGRGGADFIEGGDGRDAIDAGSGTDVVHGGLGNDTIRGGLDEDVLFGDQNNDLIAGGTHSDQLDGGGATDRVFGDGGPFPPDLEAVGAPAGDDAIFAMDGNDFLDGQDGSDTYLLSFVGGRAMSLVTVLDTGSQLGTDLFSVDGTPFADRFLLRANTDGSLAFVALLNQLSRVERINYTGVERAVVSGGLGNDEFAVDDTAAEVTLNGEAGNDFFQIGQLFRSKRTNEAANVSVDDEFATIETTRGFLSDGISAPMTVNGGLGEDQFVVFHNKAVLTLNGDQGNDLIEVRAFALAGSQEPQRERTDISGGAGADRVEYAVNAPVNIDGGDDSDTLVVIGTEFGDDFVITEDGIFGAGLTVNFVNIELLRVDGAEGDDRFFVQSTSEKFVTELFGGLGSDTFNMSGDTPPIVSNDLRGHSGIVLHDVESNDPLFDGQKLFGISANVADNDEPFAVIRQTGGSTIVTEGETTGDSYEVVLTRQPTTNVFIQALAPVPTPEERERGALAFRLSSPSPTSTTAPNGTAVTLVFTTENWFLPQIVEVRADAVEQVDNAGLLTRPELGDGQLFSFDDEAFEGVRFGVINHLVLAGSESLDGSVLAVAASPTLTIGNPSSLPAQAFEGRFVTVTLSDGVTEQRRLITDARLVAGDVELRVDRAWLTGASFPNASSTYEVEFDGGVEAGSVLGATNPGVTIPDSGIATPDELLGRRVEIVSGSGAGQSRFIVGAEAVAGGIELTVDRGWVVEDVPSATRLVVESETQRGSVFAPNVLTFEFDVGTLAPIGPGTLTVSAIADLDFSSEYLALEAEGIFSQDLFVTGGLQGLPVSTTVELSAAQLEELVADGRITFTVTPSDPNGNQDSFAVNSFVTNNELTLELSFPVPDSAFQVRIDDAFVGKMTAYDESPSNLPPTTDPDDERSTFTDSAASFPTAGEGLTGAILQIVGGPGAGQERLILGQLAGDPTHTLILNGPWSTDPVPGESVYRIERYDGLAIPSVQVQVNDDDTAGLIVDETQGLDDGAVTPDTDTITTVIEGSDGDQLGEQDAVRVRLSREPSTTVRVDLLFDGAQLELEAPGGTPLSFLEFTGGPGGNWDVFQTVVVQAGDDLLREGFHTSLIEFDITAGDADVPITGQQDEFDVPANDAVFFVGLRQLPSAVTSVEVDGMALVEADAQGQNGDYRVIGNKVLFVDANGGEVKRSGEIVVTYDFVDAGFVGAVTAPVLARIQDDDAPTVLVRESGSSTDVVEFDPATVILNPSVVRSETQTDNVFAPNVLVYEFDASTLVPTGSGVLRVSAIADLGLPFFESLRLRAEGVLDETLFGGFDGRDQSRVNTSVSLSQAQLESLVADGRVVFTVTPSAFVNNLGPNELTLRLEFPAAVASRQIQTRAGDVFAPNVLTFEFDVASLVPTGDALLHVSAIADLNLGSEFLTLDAEGQFSQDLFATGGLDGEPVATTVPITQAQLESLGADGTVTFTVTPSPAVESFVTDNELTLNLSFPATVRTEAVHQDSYELVLTGAPKDTVTVTVTPEVTKTTRTGGIRHDEIQVEISSSDARVAPELVNGVETGNLLVTFGPDDWDDPVQIDVRAVDDDFVDGGDTKEFAPGPNTVSRILGPVFIDGAGGEGSLRIGDPVMLPGETNVKEKTGDVVSVVGSQVTVSTVDLAEFLPDPTDVSGLVGKTLEITAVADPDDLTHSALGQFRLITGALVGPSETVLALNEAYDLEPGELESDIRSYAVTSESFNFFVDETTQVDFMFVHDEDSPADSSGVLTSTRLSGLNMGPDLVIDGVLRPGGITYGNLEVVEINLGLGFNDFQVLGTHRREDGFQTWTLVNTGDDVLDPNQPDATGDHVTVILTEEDVVTAFGTVVDAANEPTKSTLTLDLAAPFPDDALAGQLIRVGGSSGEVDETRRIISHTGNVLTVDRPWQDEILPLLAGEGFEIVNEADGPFALDLQGGDDFVDASASTLPLVIFGGDGSDEIHAGSDDDLLVGDRGRVDYFDEDGMIVTRVGSAPAPITGSVTGAGADTLVDAAASFPTGLEELRGLVVAITNGTGAGQTRLIVGNTATELMLDQPWVTPDRPGDVAPDATSEYRISTVPEDQTDGVERPARRLLTLDSELGGDDLIFGGLGEDVLAGGAANDGLDGGEDADLILGDNVSLNREGLLFDDFRNPRFRTLAAGETTIYDADGNPNVDGTQQLDPDRSGDPPPPVWGNWELNLLHHSVDVEADPQNRFGDDVLAGGPDADMIFGGLGDDAIHGDGAVDHDSPPFLAPSADATTDGDDYVEGNGGDDTIFGGLGQDDLVGGSSSLFSLDEPSERPDGDDTIFGGAGTGIGRNDPGDESPQGHARDADVILGDNGNVFRLLDTSGAFLTFVYDDYATPLRLIPRAAELLDYTPGGPDFDADAANDLGGNDEMHGEAGDDWLYGMRGNDVLFGDGQDDDLIGGWGHDWMSGGAGTDGLLGDDGRIFTSRNVELGNDPDPFSEPLYGVLKLDAVNQRIDTPGNIQEAIIHVEGQLKKTADLTPFNVDPDTGAQNPHFDPSHADDVLYGGLGDDFMHGGPGDDAMSGAEALPEAAALAFPVDGVPNPDRTDGQVVVSGYDAPVNPGNALGFEAFKASEFALYDEFDPLRKIQIDDAGELYEFLLNFEAFGDPADPVGTKVDDGNDVLFGDLGNDWMVGGTGQDRLYGGFGADLLNADDNLETNGGANDAPDAPEFTGTNATLPPELTLGADIAYGGAGRDVLIANSGADRLIDWVGEFNSYLVPFAPFGAFTISRAVPPALFDYLYALSAADGADQTLGSNAARNGEPEGELGLVTQKDRFPFFGWQDQTGAPDDPQPGNIPGGKRDVIRAADFNLGNLEAFAPDSGVWQVEGGELLVSAESLGGDAVSVFHVDEVLPSYFEIAATIRSGKPTAGWKANAYVIFDYQNEYDFKFAGVNASIDKMQMGRRTPEGWIVDVQSNIQAKPGVAYDVLVAVHGTNVTLVVDGEEFFSHTFAPRVVDGYTYGLNWGMVGVGSDNSRGSFDNVRVQKLPPKITFEHEEDFSDGVADLFTGAWTGSWSVLGGRYEALPLAGEDRAIRLVDLGLERGLAAGSILELQVALSTQATGGVVFDYYGPNDFKFAAIDAENGQVAIGHHTAKRGWAIDAVAEQAIDPAADHELGISLKGASVSVSVDGRVVAGHVFNAVVVDGAFGLLSAAGASSFDRVEVRTDDPAFREAEPAAALAAASIAPESALAPSALTEAELAPILEEAIRRWTEALLPAGGTLAALNALSVQIADLEGQTLGLASDDTVWIDATAAGHGWFIDSTPADDAEFRARAAEGALRATPSSPAAGSMDLLSVVMHELGHVLGLDAHHLLGATLDTGLRIEPSALPAGVEDPAPARGAAASREYAVRVLAAEGWIEEDDEPDEFSITEIRLGSDTEPARLS